MVGLLLGGGVSWFSRAHGFTANSVVSFDLVDPGGELVHVTQESDPELFWALRGGGGDFGIVVRVELRAVPRPELYGGRLLWPVEHAPEVLKAFRDLALVAPRELTMWAHVLHFPPIPDMPEPLRGRSFVNVGGDLPRLGADGRDPALVAAGRGAGRDGPDGRVHARAAR